MRRVVQVVKEVDDGAYGGRQQGLTEAEKELLTAEKWKSLRPWRLFGRQKG